jgi:tetratricopeptide (TPR) repeat protein
MRTVLPTSKMIQREGIRVHTLRSSVLLTLLLAGMLLACAVSSAYTQNPSEKDIQRTILQGIDELYNLQFDRSLETFDRVIHREPASPAGYFFKGMVHFWIFNLNRDEEHLARLEELFENAIERGEAWLEKDGANAQATFYLGGAYGFRGLAYQRNGSLWNAIWDGRRGYAYLEETIELDSTLYDAHMGFGLFRYLVARVPSSYRWVLSLLGFSGDEEGGLNSLRLAAERGIYTRTEASFFLAQFLFFEEKTDEALTYFVPLLKRYPENSVFHLAYARWQLELENPDAAKASVEKAIEINNRKDIRYGDELAYTMRYRIAFGENDFGKAKESILVAIEKSENRNNIANWMYYHLGLCYEFLAKRDSALLAYAEVQHVDDEDRAYETYASRMARERLRRPLSAPERSNIRAGNLSSGRQYEQAKEEHAAVLQMKESTVDDRAEALYGLMRLHYETEDDQEVIRLSQKIFALVPVQEHWLIPHAYWKVGQAYARLGKVAEARKALERVDEYDDYDFQGRLERRVERELRRLGES